MDFRKLLFGVESDSGVRVSSEFDVKIERKVKDKVMRFDARVKGYFVPKGGKAEFIADEIYVRGMPNVNLRNQFPGELKDIQKYALSVEYPKALARKLR
ncbi:MAG TPA: hypothetical protein VML00_11695 [Bacteroidota bacterium]|nr:hypothetical protein [Bacteroidota bacterium]